MSYARGAAAEVDVELRNGEGDLADPTQLVLRILSPDGEAETRTWPDDETITRSSAGAFKATIVLDQAGEWEYRWEATGAVETASVGTLLVERDDFEAEPDRLRTLTPTVEEVASHIPARTKDEDGNEAGTFNEETRPTAAQVRELIPKGVRRIIARVGSTICEGGDKERQAELYESARDLAAMATAMRVELRYWPEQVGNGRSPYAEMRKEWEGEVKALVEAVAEHCGGGDGESVGGSGALPVSCFPPPSGIGEVCW